jgi:menaquinone-specific isochorismate synthase
VTRPLSEAPDLVALADSRDPLVWLRGDRGCVGIGETLRLTFQGPDRFTRAAQTWRNIAQIAVVDDPIKMPGSGLIALGTFAFHDDSAAESVLIVPRMLIARHREAAWVTEITQLGEHPSHPAVTVGGSDAPAIPTPQLPRPWTGTSFVSPVQSVDSYLAGVREATERIKRGEAAKIVLARQIEGVIPSTADLRTPLQRLAERYLDCWTFAVDGLIGASPETLIRATGGAISARVLAGTRGRHAESEKRDAQARDELLTSSKEQHEHAFAVQSVVTALSPHVNELRTSEAPFPLQLPNVWHLATDLGATLKQESSCLELVNALHPTAAIAGTPTSVAVEAITELEPFDRGRYSGAVGWIDAAGDGEWVIALRCAQLEPAGKDGRRVVASAGGGIVAGSDPEHELGETVSKFRPVSEAFGE